MLAINSSLEVMEAVIFFMNTHEHEMIAVGNKSGEIKTKIDGIVLIICICCHCLGLIIVHRYYIWLNIISSLKTQVNVLMSLRLDIWLIQVCMLINPSETKWKNVLILHLVHSHNLLLKPHYKKHKCVSIIHVSWDKRRKA